MDTQHLRFLDFALRLVDSARPITRRYFRTPVAVDDKPDSSPVTIADKEIERVLSERIRAVYPSHGIFGEENGKSGVEAEWVWVIDPIDGTKSFITGRPLFGTLVALLHRGVPVIGIIDQAITDERWLGCAGRPTTYNGAAVKALTPKPLDKALMVCTTPAMFKGAEIAAFAALTARVKTTTYGGDCYSYATLASGYVDLVVESDLHPYDYLPLVPVVEGAGGVICDWAGRPLRLTSCGQVMAASGRALADAVLGHLSGAAR